METLKFKNLRNGAKMLGVVSEITPKGLVVSLPNGLRGTVARSEVSDIFTKASGKAARASDGSSSESDSDEYSDDDYGENCTLNLDELFETGQVVRCAVISLDKGKTGGKHIELTLKLSAV